MQVFSIENTHKAAKPFNLRKQKNYAKLSIDELQSTFGHSIQNLQIKSVSVNAV